MHPFRSRTAAYLFAGWMALAAALPAGAEDAPPGGERTGQDRFWSHVKEVRAGPPSRTPWTSGNFMWSGCGSAGYLNLFFWANLRDIEINFRVEPRPGLTLHLDYHHFRLDQARDAWYSTGLREVRRDVAGLSGTPLGDEIGARAVLKLWGHLELMAGYARFFPGGFLRATGPASQAGWFFTQAAYSW